MRRENIKTPEDSLSYLSDCTLATVEELVFYKKINKAQLERHISIAQTTLELCIQFNVDVKGSRAEEIHPFGSKYKDVSEWAEAQRKIFHPTSPIKS